MDFSRSWPLAVDPVVARTAATDETARTAGFVREGSRNISVTVRRQGQAIVVRVEREIPTGADVAGAALVGRFLRSVQTEVWEPVDSRGAVAARLHIDFPGRPITVEARLELQPTPSGWARTVTGRATVRLPGVGRLVERRIVAGLLASMADQWGDDAVPTSDVTSVAGLDVLA